MHSVETVLLLNKAAAHLQLQQWEAAAEAASEALRRRVAGWRCCAAAAVLACAP
jgi:hypothetical protein